MNQKTLRPNLTIECLEDRCTPSISSYLFTDGVQGEAHDSNPKPGTFIELQSFSFGQGSRNGLSPPGSSPGSTGATADHPKFGELVLNKPKDQSTVTPNPPAGSQSSYLQIQLHEILVSSYSFSGSGEQAPTESIKLNFTKINFAYTPQSPDNTGAPGSTNGATTPSPGSGPTQGSTLPGSNGSPTPTTPTSPGSGPTTCPPGN
jgi:type VI secretion system secreted protein Hcp